MQHAIRRVALEIKVGAIVDPNSLTYQIRYDGKSRRKIDDIIFTNKDFIINKYKENDSLYKIACTLLENNQIEINKNSKILIDCEYKDSNILKWLGNIHISEMTVNYYNKIIRQKIANLCGISISTVNSLILAPKINSVKQHYFHTEVTATQIILDMSKKDNRFSIQEDKVIKEYDQFKYGAAF